MTRIYHLFIALLAFMAFSCPIQAQDDYEERVNAENWYADRCENAVLRFEGLCRNADHHAQRYCVFPSSQAAPLGYALAIASNDKSEVFMFTPNGNDLKAERIDVSIIPEGDTYWDGISNLGNRRTQSKDITLRERPIPIRTLNKSKNSFVAVLDADEHIANIKAYNQMMFKPHKNGVRMASEREDKKTDGDGNVIKDEYEYVFKLLQPSVVAKMFRGYEDMEACPWVVKSSFFNNHTLLQFSRWKEGEPIKKASPGLCRIISGFYGGRPVKDSRWLATTESGERSFYAVQFEVSGKEALAALVCVAGGAVTSSWEFLAEVDPANYNDGQSLWFVDDEGDFMSHAPEIHCIVETDEGMELYVRLFGGESVQYYVLREMGKVWMEIQTDYWISIFE